MSQTRTLETLMFRFIFILLTFVFVVFTFIFIVFIFMSISFIYNHDIYYMGVVLNPLLANLVETLLWWFCRAKTHDFSTEGARRRKGERKVVCIYIYISAYTFFCFCFFLSFPSSFVWKNNNDEDDDDDDY